MAHDGWNSTQAESWLSVAGTATNYTGLFDVVRAFSRPTMEQMRSVPSDFPESEKVSGLADAMVSIDERWEHLKLVPAAGYPVLKEHPHIKPGNEAVILWEHYREAQRLPEAVHHGTDFIDR